MNINYAANGTLPKLCYNITILRSIHCSNTTLSFGSWFEVLISTESYIINSSPWKTKVIIEECGMYVMKTNNINAALQYIIILYRSVFSFLSPNCPHISLVFDLPNTLQKLYMLDSIQLQSVWKKEQGVLHCVL